MFNKKSKLSFKNFRRKNFEILNSPISGNIISLKEVPDEVFSSEMMGKGIAIKPSEGKVYSPVDGLISTIFNTNHAITIVSDKGAEILIHIGIDTVKLKGNYFNSFVESNDKVKTGQLLIEFDIEKIIEEGYSIITPIIITNSESYQDIITLNKNSVVYGDELFKLISI